MYVKIKIFNHCSKLMKEKLNPKKYKVCQSFFKLTLCKNFTYYFELSIIPHYFSQILQKAVWPHSPEFRVQFSNDESIVNKNGCLAIIVSLTTKTY